MSGEKNQEQNLSSEFIERRRAALERYLNRTAAHPVLSVDPDFRDFLEAGKDIFFFKTTNYVQITFNFYYFTDVELPKATNTSALSGAGMMRLLNKVGETVNKITYKMDENDTVNYLFCEIIQQFDYILLSYMRKICFSGSRRKQRK